METITSIDQIHENSIFEAYDRYLCIRPQCAGMTLRAAIEAAPNRNRWEGFRGELVHLTDQNELDTIRAAWARLNLPFSCECGRLT